MEDYEALLQETKKAMFVVIKKMKQSNLTQDKEIQYRKELIVLQQTWLDVNQLMINLVSEAKYKTEQQLHKLRGGIKNQNQSQ